MIAEKIRKMLQEDAGIRIDGPEPWDIQVRDERWYRRVWRQKNLGLGESYMDGWWDCARLDEVFHRLLRTDIEHRVAGGLGHFLHGLPGILLNLQTRLQARKNSRRHYDLGNDLFFSFLDPHNQYSCGFFEGTAELATAQEQKMVLLADKLQLRPGDRLLDIGSGWGGFARFAAERYGCVVTGVNVSLEQLRHAREYCRGFPVKFLNCDYRAITGEYDKIVSVGMFEHVGLKNYRTFMNVARRTLAPAGTFLLHTIANNDSGLGRTDPWISRYIFPNSMLPSLAQITKAVEGLFVVEDCHNLGPHYDKTLMAWHENFTAAWPQLSLSRDERFRRMWEYYLLSCAGAFRARNMQVWQVVMTGQGTGVSQPRCRAPYFGS